MCVLYVREYVYMCGLYLYGYIHSYVFECNRVFVGVSFTMWMLYHVRVIHNGYVVLEFIQGVFSGWVC